MRGSARLVALTLVAGVLAVVPPGTALAATGDLDVSPEDGLVKIAADAKLELTATVTADGTTTPLADATIYYRIESGFGSDVTPEHGMSGIGAEGCGPTDATGICKFNVPGPTSGTTNTESVIRLWVEDDMIPGPVLEADTAETLPDEPPAMKDNTDVVRIRWQVPAGTTLEITPETQTKQPGQEASLEALVMDQFTPSSPVAGARVDAEIEAGSPNVNQKPTGVDLECAAVTDAMGKCTLKYTGKTGTGSAGTDKIRAWIDTNNNQSVPDAADGIDTTEGQAEATAPGSKAEPDNTDVVNVTWAAGQGIDLDVEPETQTLVLPEATTAATTAATDASFTATVLDGGAPAANKVVLFSVTEGPNMGTDFECTTGTNGTCTAMLTGTTAGADEVRGVVDSDANGLPNEADPTEGPDEGAEPGTNDEVDETDIVTVTWEEPPPPPPPACTGTAGDDVLIGTEEDDTCNGKGGDDVIRTLGGNDTAKGGGGNDKLTLGDGDDQGNGGPGADRLRGGAGNDNLNGGGGKSDSARGGSGKDTCKAEKEFGCEK